MKRPWLVWLAFGGCLLLLLATLAWLSTTTLRQERAQLLAEQQAAFEEKVRLALWRMDSILTPLVVQESSSPFFAYTQANGPRDEGRTLPPHLQGDSTNVLLHFEYDSAGGLTSPEMAAIPSTPSQLRTASLQVLPGFDDPATAQRLDTLRGIINPTQLLVACAATLPAVTVTNAWSEPAQVLERLNSQGIVGKARFQQQVLNQAEQNARVQAYEKVSGNAFATNLVAHGAVRPVWLGPALVLARRATFNRHDSIQGAWLNWPLLEQSMLSSIRDLLPDAKLEPIPADYDDPQGRRLASLPLRLNPGAPPVLAHVRASPVRQALYIAWPCLLLAAAAVGLLLHAAISLSERRGTFVSAVTHELRTPLTTFKMYSEMLAEGMVTDPAKRQQYLKTLNREASRLHHLVENVLAYARLERGSARRQIETLTVEELLQRLQPRLEERTTQAGLRIQVEASEETRKVRVSSDPSAIEQILFNLVDNACKYAAPRSSDPTLHIRAQTDARFLYLRIADHGPGISPDVVKRLFRPFSKTDQEAAQSAPGVGLGLSLCRRLSRSLGGNLRLESTTTQGAIFILQLPLT